MKRKAMLGIMCSLIMSMAVSAYGESNTPQETDSTSQGAWVLAKEVDEFGDTIEDSDNIVIESYAEGDFSNTATAKSDLLVEIGDTLVNGNHVFYFTLYEYAKTPATYSENSEKTLKIKVGDTITGYSLDGIAPNGHLFLGATNSDGNELFSYLYAGYDVRCIIYIDSSQYNFTISSNGFQEVCAKAQEKFDAVEEKNRIKDVSSVINNILTSEDGAAKLVEAYEYLESSREEYALMSDEDIKNEINGDFYYTNFMQFNGIVMTYRYIMNYNGNEETQKLYWKDGVSDMNPETKNYTSEFVYSNGIITSWFNSCQIRKMADGYYVAYGLKGSDYTVPTIVIMKGHQDSTGFVFDYPLPE
jgi:hypothetical protein